MTKEAEPQGGFDEVLAQYPDLARVRELFIDLFQDRTPLVNLGYTARQIEFALPVLRLLEDKGRVVTSLPNNPYLYFNDPDDPGAESLGISYLPKREGFDLSGFRDEAFRGWSGLSYEERLWRFFLQPRSVVIHQDFLQAVARIGLFEEGAEIDNLDYLINQFFNRSFTNARMGMMAENPATRAARAVGVAGTYRAAWVDERTKLEFVAKMDIPEDKSTGSTYVTFRKLTPVFDSRGKMVPIGKKASTSEDKVTKILSARNRQAVSGELAWGNARL